MRRDVFYEAGGFDDVHLPVAFNDVDLCLRLRRRGYRIVFTPYALLRHFESASRGREVDVVEDEVMRVRWGKYLTADPYYNPNQSMIREDFSLS